MGLHALSYQGYTPNTFQDVTMTYRPRRGGPSPAPALTRIPPRDRNSKLETYRPVVLCPQNWVLLLRDDHALGGVLDFRRG